MDCGYYGLQSKIWILSSFSGCQVLESRMHLKLINTILDQGIGNGAVENQSMIRFLKLQGWLGIVWNMFTTNMDAWTQVPCLLWEAW